MKLIEEDEYEDLAMEFQYRIVEILDNTLKAKGVSEAKRAEICEDFNFDFSMFLDEGEVEFDEKNYYPRVAFEKDKQLWLNSGVLHHEYAFGVSTDYFENTDK